MQGSYRGGRPEGRERPPSDRTGQTTGSGRDGTTDGPGNGDSRDGVRHAKGAEGREGRAHGTCANATIGQLISAKAEPAHQKGAPDGSALSDSGPAPGKTPSTESSRPGSNR